MNLIYKLATPIQVGDLNNRITVTKLKLVSVSVNFEDIYAHKNAAILSICMVDPDSGYPVNVMYQDQHALNIAKIVNGAIAAQLLARMQGDGKLPAGTILSTTKTALTASSATAAVGASVTLSVTVTSGGGTPTGSVTFYDGQTSLGTAVLDATGAASLAVTTLPAGTNAITASFTPTGTFDVSASQPVTVTIG